jgi:hypothetical protein
VAIVVRRTVKASVGGDPAVSANADAAAARYDAVGRNMHAMPDVDATVGFVSEVGVITPDDVAGFVLMTACHDEDVAVNPAAVVNRDVLWRRETRTLGDDAASPEAAEAGFPIEISEFVAYGAWKCRYKHLDQTQWDE